MAPGEARRPVAPGESAPAAHHHRAARVLHDGGAKAATVARHLLLARPAHGDWAVPALSEAARQALLDDDHAYAVDCLRLAHGLSERSAERCRIALGLASVVRRTDPGAAEEYLVEPLRALRRGELTYDGCGLLARLLLTQGRVQEAAEALGHAEGQRAAGAVGEDPLSDLIAPPAPGGRTAAALPRAAALWSPAAVDEAVTEALLKDTPLTHRTFDLVVQAVRALVHADRCDRAVVWCQKLRAEADRARAPGWYATLGLLHAQALLRQGDLTGARHEAAAAAAAVEGRGGLLLAGIVAAETAALVAMGDVEAAARRLELPVPQGVFSSVYALDRLRARGRYHLAAQRPHAALAEFLDAGGLARRWALDQPRHLPWRTDAAEALVRLGEHRRAERLVTEELALPDARGPRLRGIGLRLRAATAPPAERPRLLKRAVEELRHSGARLEHALALADLGRALQLTGAGSRAGTVARRAWHLAAACGARALCEQVLPDRGERSRAAEGEVAADGPAGPLTDSERRVASLAALGYTNREIAAELYVTVSTVEQHLTHAYRKLNISRRHQLPMDLHAEAE